MARYAKPPSNVHKFSVMVFCYGQCLVAGLGGGGGGNVKLLQEVFLIMGSLSVSPLFLFIFIFFKAISLLMSKE